MARLAPSAKHWPPPRNKSEANSSMRHTSRIDALPKRSSILVDTSPWHSAFPGCHPIGDHRKCLGSIKYHQWMTHLYARSLDCDCVCEDSVGQHALERSNTMVSILNTGTLHCILFFLLFHNLQGCHPMRLLLQIHRQLRKPGEGSVILRNLSTFFKSRFSAR